MAEVNLMDRYPRTKRNLEERAQVSEGDRQIARQFGQEFFDGPRDQGYGGYYYHPRFWQETVKRFRDYHQLPDNAAVLDVGCGKGFMLHDFRELMPSMTIAGIDISTYAIENAMEDVKPFLKVGNARDLPYPDNSFDLVISINTVHNLEEEDCFRAVQEIQRVSRKHAFIMVDAYRNDEEKRTMEIWNLTARTYYHSDEWERFFERAGYTGDYYWFIAE